MKWVRVAVLGVGMALLMGSSGDGAWRMKADYVEACSCHLFCPCYFNKHAEHPFCEFNMAVKVREGRSGTLRRDIQSPPTTRLVVQIFGVGAR